MLSKTSEQNLGWSQLSWLCGLDNACEQMSFKIINIELVSEGSTPCLDKDVAMDYVEGGTTCHKYLDDTTKRCRRGGTTCLKWLDDMPKSCMEKYVNNIDNNKSHMERSANDVQYESNMERYADDIEYESYNERCTDNDSPYNIEYKSRLERCTNNV